MNKDKKENKNLLAIGVGAVATCMGTYVLYELTCATVKYFRCKYLLWKTNKNNKL